MKVEQEVTTEVVSDVSPVETVEALEGTEAEETKKAKVSGTKMEVAPMKPEVIEVEQITEEVKEEAPKGEAESYIVVRTQRVDVILSDIILTSLL